MNIDNLLNLEMGITAQAPDGTRAKVRVGGLREEDEFVLVPEDTLPVGVGDIVKVTDGQDSVLAKVVDVSHEGLRLCMECYLSPGHERRSDVRIYDRVHYSVGFVCHGNERGRLLAETLEGIQAEKAVMNSFIRGRYPRHGMSEPSGRTGSPLDQRLWEIDRKLDMLIHMTFSQDFRALMHTPQRDVNISASGMRFISREPYDLSDIVEIRLILPMVPLLMVHLVGEVIRQKPLSSSPEADRYAVAVRFHRVDSETREDIIRYLFRRQREILRNRQV